jgi:hypothetical protein
MTKEEFCQTDRIVLNYFVPFTNGKFISTCLMLSDDVYKMISADKIVQRLATPHSDWNKIEYSDVDFWWQDHSIDWFNSDNWFSNLSESAVEAIQQNKYIFYTCHEDYSVNYLKTIFTNAQVLVVTPNFDLCKKNYLQKNWYKEEPVFEESRVFKEFNNFKPIPTHLTINQLDIYNKNLFIEAITKLSIELNITLNTNQVLAYRNLYLSNKFNQ